VYCILAAAYTVFPSRSWVRWFGSLDSGGKKCNNGKNKDSWFAKMEGSACRGSVGISCSPSVVFYRRGAGACW
jgi:hypothetical protein